ncbi:1,2-dihydroxy-3-keto-5-methylthiopentene dioxygenase [Cylindrobasidium torrendii FP15055 ss-10]|uniref:Acireductone dioxygenase n=1 Tax=Cylindrobasidium torrendii FP15055 ss-10 TaxID=1314674 RepID=A0A0D7BTA8_9AGAR|nr:1,2-dihydroxy-3-keto-5-methylthiopentene dioxygenase [Cylindrobasidium torrendii FP15055 ss-10]
MRAYYFDELPGDQRLPHDSAREVPPEVLKAIHVQALNIPLEGYEQAVTQYATDKGYQNHDVISMSKEGLGEAYEAKSKMFFAEHLHEDDEARYIIEGSGYFDLREQSDAWIRVAVVPGDLLIVPAGIYHRFTLDTHDYVKAMRLFKDAPKWEAIYRGEQSDNHPVRKAYLESTSL